MKLIVGLGNIGEEYKLTRHNIGFLILDHFISKLGKSFRSERLYDYVIVKDAVLIKPKTFMNRSGLAFKAASERWNPEDSLVVYDDIELPVAELRFRERGGDGGHNGIKSLLEVISADQLKRLRIGIGKNVDHKAEKYVLDQIPSADWELLSQSFDRIGGFLKTYIARDFASMLDEYSKWKKTYSGESDSGIISPKED